MDDSDIIAAIEAGDPAGLTAAYDKYAAGVYAYCRWILRDAPHAADALVRTFMAARAELGGLKHAGEARSWLYATARAECYRRDPPARSAGGNVVLAYANLTGFLTHEHEAIELTLRHDLSEAELAAILDMTWAEAQAVAARARDHLTAPSPPLDTLPPELREHLLRRAAAGADPVSEEGTIRRPRSTGMRPRSTGIMSFQRLGQMGAWSRIRANPGVAAALTAVAIWAVAAMSATLITLTGTHGDRALATETHGAKPAAISPPAGGPISPSTEVSSPRSPRPAGSPTLRGVAPPTTKPSPTQPAKPPPSRSPSPSASVSASSSPSPTPSPSPSPSTSASPTA
jgi:DNA-directed RNA polymerase specialized sigma24 family protein